MEESLVFSEAAVMSRHARCPLSTERIPASIIRNCADLELLPVIEGPDLMTRFGLGEAEGA